MQSIQSILILLLVAVIWCKEKTEPGTLHLGSSRFQVTAWEQLSDTTGFAKYILYGAYIDCDGKDHKCLRHDLVEDFPAQATDVFYDKGWRYINGLVLCPDCCAGTNR